MTVALAHTILGDRSRPMLVMSSSLGTTRSMWEPQYALQSQYCLLLYDHRGHGESPAPDGPYTVEELGADVIALLDHLGVHSASFCGLSLGGMVGLWLASHHPQRIDRLIAMCALARLEPVSRYSDRALAVRAGGLASIAGEVVSRWFTPAFVERVPTTVGRFTRELTGQSAEGYASCCEALASCDLRDRIHRIDAPTMLIAGADDPIVRPSAAVLFGASFRDASVAVVPDAAHLVNVEQPDIVSRLVLEHLAEQRGED
ncbi:MAG TPA: alpha/beta fold hydrolase [Candidatus Saccharimonadales bacterium]|nr:alpha/beta fold hydrolase [Candidatus Saccharimonadales bacterium]